VLDAKLAARNDTSNISYLSFTATPKAKGSMNTNLPTNACSGLSGVG
jgi:hypothetical protein